MAMTAATTILLDHAIEAAEAGGHTRTGAPTGWPVGDAMVQDLLRQRAGLPAGHPGRVALRTRSVEAGLPLARRLAGRYRGRGEPLDDLYQVAALALVQAVDRYDPARQAAFTSYALPTIVGALKRHFRDTTWRVRVPRPVQELAVRLTPASVGLAQQLGRTPTQRDLATHLDTVEEDIAEALNAWQAHRPQSLDAPSTPDGEDRRALIDTLGAVDPCLDAVTDRQALRPLLAALPARQRRILALRYFDDLTQAEIAAQVGVSQMHVSRLLARTLAELRTAMLADGTPHPTHPAGRRCGTPATGTGLGSPPAPAATPAGSGPTTTAAHRSEQEEQHHGTDDRGEPGAQVEERVQRLHPEQLLGEKSAQERTDDPDNGGQQEAGPSSGEVFGDEAGDGTEHDPRDNAHDALLTRGPTSEAGRPTGGSPQPADP
jgi:RNA polymerase sigma-B factor